MNRLPDRRRARVLPENPLRAAIGMFVLLASLYAVQLANATLFGMELSRYYGLVPRQIEGLDGILFAPLLHANWAHLISNSVPLLVLGWLVLAGGVRQFTAVTATVWIIAGLGTWLIGNGTAPHVGASSIIFGWMVFLLVRGFLLRSIGQILVAVVLFFYWGSMLWGVFPGQPTVSWEGHLFGALGGLVAAWLVARTAAPRRPTGGTAGRLTA